MSSRQNLVEHIAVNMLVVWWGFVSVLLLEWNDPCCDEVAIDLIPLTTESQVNLKSRDQISILIGYFKNVCKCCTCSLMSIAQDCH